MSLRITTKDESVEGIWGHSIAPYVNNNFQKLKNNYFSILQAIQYKKRTSPVVNMVVFGGSLLSANSLPDRYSYPACSVSSEPPIIPYPG